MIVRPRALCQSLAAALTLASVATGCTSSPSGSMPSAAVPPLAAQDSVASVAGRYIKHVVIVVQENRSFENIFAGFPGADAPLSGTMAGANGTPAAVPLKTISFHNCYELSHLWADALAGYDKGKMDGFGSVQQTSRCAGKSFPLKAGTDAYVRLDRNEVAPYWTMARRYVLADRMFPTMFGPSFTAHIDLIASTAALSPTESLFDLPNDGAAAAWGCDATPGTPTSVIHRVDGVARLDYDGGPFPCFDQFQTIAGRLDRASISWKYYAPAFNDGSNEGHLWSIFDAVKDVACTNYVDGSPAQPSGGCARGKDWSQSIASASPPSTVLRDVARRKLPQVAWVIPDARDSDHADLQSDTGPSWVAAVVNAIGASPYWKSTAIVVLWDDWGGWYDDAVPPKVGFVGTGIRVPCIVISPYARAGRVSHTQYAFGSVVRLVEQVFGLRPLAPQSLGYTDVTSASLLDAFRFTQKPLVFRKIPAKYPASYFLHEKPSMLAPDND